MAEKEIPAGADLTKFPTIGTYKPNPELAEAFKKAMEESPHVLVIPEKPRWIPCSERLPEVYERVLTADKDGNVIENFRCNIKTGALEWSKGFWITHWMPMPEPPESEVQHD